MLNKSHATLIAVGKHNIAIGETKDFGFLQGQTVLEYMKANAISILINYSVDGKDRVGNVNIDEDVFVYSKKRLEKLRFRLGAYLKFAASCDVLVSCCKLDIEDAVEKTRENRDPNSFDVMYKRSIRNSSRG